MTDFDKIIYGFVFSAVGTVLGWMLNQTGQWFKSRGDDKRRQKVILYNLLETYFFLFRSDLDLVSSKTADKVLTLMPEAERTEVNRQLIANIYSSLVESTVAPMIKSQLETAKNNYIESIKSLAEIDPINAYYMNGRTNIIDYFDSVHKWVDSVDIITTDSTDEVRPKTQRVLKEIKPGFLKDLLSDLEKDIRRIAWRVNPIVWIKARKAIKYLKFSASSQIDKEIDKVFLQISSLAGKPQ